MRSRCIVTVVAVFFVVAPIIGQAQRSNGRNGQQEWWFNVPSSPLEFRLLSNKRFLALFNRSAGDVVEFKLGCVIQDKGQVRVVFKGKAINTHIAAASGLGQQMYFKDLLSYAEEAERCNKDNSEVAVVEVSFADGAIWMVKE